jgi:hypothetical protein
VGNVDVETIVYRQRLAETSWLLIQQNLIFGSPYFLSYMEELRQGQGIIDLVNAYATVALGYGLVGFGLFVGFYSTVIVATFRTVRRYSFFDHDFAMLGAPLIACLVGAMLIIATSPNYLSIPYIHLTLAALAVAYVKLGKLEDVATPYYGSTSVAAA